MSEKRFTVMKKFDGSYVICDKGKMLVADDCCDLLNRQQTSIETMLENMEKLEKENEQLKNKLEVANARSGYYQRMFEKWCVKDE